MDEQKTDNLRFWNALSRPPQTALKSIQAGRLKGKSDINPQWRMQALTEEFGPYGIGWYFTVDRKWSEPGSQGQICVFADVSLYVKYPDTDEWTPAAPGTGGNMLVEMESKGLHTSDEAYKMAVTDALSVAAKALGLAAEIYLGNFDGSKYRNPPQEESAPAASVTLDPRLDNLRKRFHAVAREIGDVERLHDRLKQANHLESFNDATPEMLERAIKAMESAKQERKAS